MVDLNLYTFIYALPVKELFSRSGALESAFLLHQFIELYCCHFS